MNIQRSAITTSEFKFEYYASVSGHLKVFPPREFLTINVKAPRYFTQLQANESRTSLFRPQLQSNGPILALFFYLSVYVQQYEPRLSSRKLWHKDKLSLDFRGMRV